MDLFSFRNPKDVIAGVMLLLLLWVLFMPALAAAAFTFDSLPTPSSKQMAICGSTFFEPTGRSPVPDGVLLSDKPETLQSAGLTVHQLHVLNNRTLPQLPVRCTFELMACGRCEIAVKLNPLHDNDAHSNLQRTAQLGCADRPVNNQSCFDLQFVEDRADAVRYDLSGNQAFRTTSIWNATSGFNSTSYKLKIVLSMWNVAQNPQLKQLIGSLFPLQIRVFGKNAVYPDFKRTCIPLYLWILFREHRCDPWTTS